MIINTVSGGGGGYQPTPSLGENCVTEFNSDGSITQTYSDRIHNTVFQTDGTIVESLSDLQDTVYQTKTKVFNVDGSITETVSSV